MPAGPIAGNAKPPAAAPSKSLRESKMAANPNTWLDRRSRGRAGPHLLPSGPLRHRQPRARGPAVSSTCWPRPGVRYWQICPIGPTGFGDSPYQTFSGRAGNPYFIDLGELARRPASLRRRPGRLRALPGRPRGLRRPLRALLGGAFAGPTTGSRPRARTRWPASARFSAFRRKHAELAEPFADFMALKSHFGGHPWTTWPEQFRCMESAAEVRDAGLGASESDRHAFYQYLFFGQWDRLRRYAADHGVGIIGDVPIFVALDSADTWQNRAVFQLDGQGQPARRRRRAAGLFLEQRPALGKPALRLGLPCPHRIRVVDRPPARPHSRSTTSSGWTISAASTPTGRSRRAPTDARSGRWRKGPGTCVFQGGRRGRFPARGSSPRISATSGRTSSSCAGGPGLPGMKILQFAYGHDRHNVNLPHFYPADSVAYTGTHDNNTTRGWLESLSEPYAGLGRRLLPARRLQVGLAHDPDAAWPRVSRLAVVPMQDLLDLPASATLNRPGTAEGNWQWRFTRTAARPAARSESSRRCALDRALRPHRRPRPLRDYSEPPEA